MADELNIDLSNYKDRVGQRVTPGRYPVIVDDVELDKSNAGNDMINVWFRIVGGEFDGAVIIDRLTQTEKAMFRTVGFMQGIGLPTPKKRLRVNIRQWVGKRLEIDVEDGEPYNGRVKSEVRGYLRIAKGAAAAESDQDSGDLDGLEALSDTEPVSDESAPPEADDSEVDLESVDLR
jgi:hypothetical protein